MGVRVTCDRCGEELLRVTTDENPPRELDTLSGFSVSLDYVMRNGDIEGSSTTLGYLCDECSSALRQWIRRSARDASGT